jgi:hypothetical protein
MHTRWPKLESPKADEQWVIGKVSRKQEKPKNHYFSLISCISFRKTVTNLNLKDFLQY